MSPAHIEWEWVDMGKGRTAATAAATTFAAVAASIFGTPIKAEADPYIPPTYVNYNVPPSDTTATIIDPNTGQQATGPVVITGGVAIYGSETPNGPETELASATFAPGETVSLMTPASPSAAVADGANFINTTWSGCRTVDRWADASIDFLFYTQTLFQYHVELDWCGDGHGGVSKPAHHDYWTDVFGSFEIGNRVTDFGNYYNAWGNYQGHDWPKSGYDVFMQGAITGNVPNCGLCTTHFYPWDRVIGFADGVAYTEAGF